MIHAALLLLMFTDADLPALSDLGRFPDANATEEQLSLHRQYEAWLEDQARFGGDRHATIIARVRQSRGAWELLWAAHQDFLMTEEARRYYLQLLKERLGDAAYEQRRMPPALPTYTPAVPKRMERDDSTPAANNATP